MKKLLIVLLISTCWCVAFSQSAAEKNVMDAVTKLNNAIIAEDTNTLKTLTDKNLSFGHSSGKVENQQEFVTNVSKGAIHFKTIDITEQTISIAGRDAIVRNVLHGKITTNAQPGEITLHILMVWRKKHGSWKLFARQGFRTPS